MELVISDSFAVAAQRPLRFVSEFLGLCEVGFCLGLVTLLRERCRPIVIRFAELWIEPEGFVLICQRLAEVAFLHICHATIAVC